jgi:hypothetical protein
MTISGRVMDMEAREVSLEARLVSGGKPNPWQRLQITFAGSAFEARLEASAGGWYRLEVRALMGDQVRAETEVETVGIGEVFLVAGQSNSANHGQEKQHTKTGKVAAFNGKRWQLADDPQPGASGSGGSFMPPFGDALVERFQVPVGFVACGVGASSVREWLPPGSRFSNPPTIVSRVRQLPGGELECLGQAFGVLSARLKVLGPHGLRAVLWHQGESDANQKDPTRTLPGHLYGEYLKKIILNSRRASGWEVPWFVAQVSYHVPGDEASPDIRAAQASLWKVGLALPGPDTDALKAEWREANGKGVHFSGAGLREHAARWVDRVAPWLEQQLK